MKNVETIEKNEKKYHNNHPAADEQETKSHFLLETKDYVSWLQKQNDEKAISNCLLYPHSRPQVLQNADANAKSMNRIPKSLLHYKYTFENPMKKYETASPQDKKIKSSTKLMNQVLA